MVFSLFMFIFYQKFEQNDKMKNMKFKGLYLVSIVLSIISCIPIFLFYITISSINNILLIIFYMFMLPGLFIWLMALIMLIVGIIYNIKQRKHIAYLLVLNIIFFFFLMIRHPQYFPLLPSVSLFR